MKNEKFTQLCDTLFACGLSTVEMEKIADIVVELMKIEFKAGWQEGAKAYDKLLRESMEQKLS
jgi:hypothetical protein